jgi:hypothetical protein
VRSVYPHNTMSHLSIVFTCFQFSNDFLLQLSRVVYLRHGTKTIPSLPGHSVDHCGIPIFH